MAGKPKYGVGSVLSNGRELVEKAGYDSKNRVYLWYWKCPDCGTVNGPSRTHSIHRKDRKVARCCLVQKGASNHNWRGYEGLTGVWLGQRLSDAERRGLEWAVTPEYLWQLWLDQQGKCWYSGVELELHNGKSGQTASLDRTDNILGYVPGNVKWVHTTVNKMKTNLSEDEFLTFCRLIN